MIDYRVVLDVCSADGVIAASSCPILAPYVKPKTQKCLAARKLEEVSISLDPLMYTVLPLKMRTNRISEKPPL